MRYDMTILIGGLRMAFIKTCLFVFLIVGDTTASTDDGFTKLAEYIGHIIHTELSGCSNILMYESEELAENVIKNNNLVNSGITLINLDNISTDDLKHFEVRQLSREPTKCLNFVVLFEKRNFIKILEANEIFWGENKKVFLVFTISIDSSEAQKFVLQNTFRNCAHLTYLRKLGEGNDWEANQLLNPSGLTGREVKQTKLGTLNLMKGSPLFDQKEIMDFHGYQFSIAMLTYSPYVIGDSTSGTEKYRGFEIMLLETVTKYTNSTYRLSSPADEQWGTINENGSWTGMIGMVKREEADFAIGAIGRNPMRNTVVDFSDDFLYDHIELVTPRAKSLPSWQGPIRPFSDFVWGFSMVIFFVASFALRFITGVVSSHIKDPIFESMSNCFLFVLSGLLMRGNFPSYKKNSGRVFVTFWLLPSMIISITYTSALISFLINPGFLQPVKTFQELIDSDLKVQSVYSGDIIYLALTKGNDTTLRAVGEKVTWNDDITDNMVGVAEGRIATWETTLAMKLMVAQEYHDKNGDSLITFTGEYLTASASANWPLRKKGPFINRFNKIIGRYIEAGLMDISIEETLRLEKNRFQKTAFADVQSEETQESRIILSLKHFQGPFIILLFGYLIATVMWIIEIIFPKGCNK